MNLLLTLICSTFFHFSFCQHEAAVEWKSDCVENGTCMGCHFGGDQVENSLRAALIQAVKDLCVRKRRQNKSKDDKKTELTAVYVSFLSFCLC